MNINKLRSFFSSNPTQQESADVTNAQAEIGFKLTYFEKTKQLVVKVIGARNLPRSYGTIKPEGYLVKVTVYPGKDKFETEMAVNSWPTFNQELTFDLQKTASTIREQFLGKFITLTVYAVLENSSTTQKPGKGLQRSNSLRKSFKFLTGRNDEVQLRKGNGAKYSANRFTFNNRRTIGAVTYSLDPKKFTQKNYSTHATPDIWRFIQNISSGIDIEKKEAKCNVEVSLAYYNSEDGKNDRMEVSLSKLKCSMQAMQEHEKYGGSLYLKMTVFEYGDRIASWKSDRFNPTISMKIEPSTATLHAIFQNYNLRDLKIYVRLICKTMLTKKILLGKLEIDNGSDLFKEAIQTPSTTFTRSLDMES